MARYKVDLDIKRDGSLVAEAYTGDPRVEAIKIEWSTTRNGLKKGRKDEASGQSQKFYNDIEGRESCNVKVVARFVDKSGYNEYGKDDDDKHWDPPDWS